MNITIGYLYSGLEFSNETVTRWAEHSSVNIRGHRLELEAIEAAVLLDPRITGAAARLWPDETNESRLIIYVVVKDGSIPTLFDVRTSLTGQLPEAILPSEVVVLPTLPLNADGAVDRDRLPPPAPQKTDENATTNAVLPRGVTALQAHGSRPNIFWVHTLSFDLGRKIDPDQPLYFVTLTAEDLAALGPSPSLESIGARLMQKIVATQPSGPYAIGGFCLGGIMAYEIAFQLRAAGCQVALLVLVDPPNPAYEEPHNAVERLANYLPYALRRASRLGLRISFRYFYGHVTEYFERLVKTKAYAVAWGVGQKTIEAAAVTYQPKTYDGRVLLLLAAERPPHKDFLPGWQAVVPNRLETDYINAHHRDLLRGENARSVANSISAHLKSGNSASSARGGEDSEAAGSVHPDGLATA
jgi:thioesterase domain-containing protein